MFSGESLRFLIAVSAMALSLMVINSIFGGVGTLIGVAVLVVFFLKTNAGDTLARFLKWASNLG